MEQQELFIALSKKGYTIRNKRVIGDPACTSEVTRNKDLIMELALVIEWIRLNFGVVIAVYPQRYEGVKLMWSYSLLKVEEGYLVDGLEFPEVSDPMKIPVWKT